MPKIGIPLLKTFYVYQCLVLGSCDWEYVIIFLNLSQFLLSLSNKDSVIHATLLLVRPMVQPELAKRQETFRRDI